MLLNLTHIFFYTSSKCIYEIETRRREDSADIEFCGQSYRLWCKINWN